MKIIAKTTPVQYRNHQNTINQTFMFDDTELVCIIIAKPSIFRFNEYGIEFVIQHKHLSTSINIEEGKKVYDFIVNEFNNSLNKH